MSNLCDCMFLHSYSICGSTIMFCCHGRPWVWHVQCVETPSLRCHGWKAEQKLNLMIRYTLCLLVWNPNPLDGSHVNIRLDDFMAILLLIQQYTVNVSGMAFSSPLNYYETRWFAASTPDIQMGQNSSWPQITSDYLSCQEHQQYKGCWSVVEILNIICSKSKKISLSDGL